jgi:hypothetical protein
MNNSEKNRGVREIGQKMSKFCPKSANFGRAQGFNRDQLHIPRKSQIRGALESSCRGSRKNIRDLAGMFWFQNRTLA